MQRLVLAGFMFLFASLSLACGSGDTGQDEYDALTKGMYVVGSLQESGPELQARLERLLAFAEQKSDKAIGLDAFRLAETAFLDDANTFHERSGPERPFVSRAPVPPDVASTIEDDILASCLGFVSAVPDPYRASRVYELIERDIRREVQECFDDLEATVESRLDWATTLRAGGTVFGSYSGNVMNSSEKYAGVAQLLTFLHNSAPSADVPPQIMPALEGLMTAAELAKYEPPHTGTSDVTSDSAGVTVHRSYTEADVGEGEKHAAELSAAVDEARQLLAAIPATPTP